MAGSCTVSLLAPASAPVLRRGACVVVEHSFALAVRLASYLPEC